MPIKMFYVYLLTNKKRSTLYTGVTSDLVKRVYQHKNKWLEGFTKKYCVDQLVYFEIHEDLLIAFEREKQIKKWYRKWKIQLIEQQNPNWLDLYESIL